MSHNGKKIYLGIDEAGRGSVIGPLVIGAVSIDESTLNLYETTEITDSKKLSPEKRQKLFDLIKETSQTNSTDILEPEVVDAAVLSSSINLNILELQSMTKLIMANPNSTDIFIDAISKPDYCTSNLRNLLKAEETVISVKKVNAETLNITRKIGDFKTFTTLLAQNKADLNFKVVSAASIIAKVTRDKLIRDIELEYNLEDGILASGYPNDQLKPFLQKYKNQIKNRELRFIRYSWDWQPLKSILVPEKFKQTKLI